MRIGGISKGPKKYLFFGALAILIVSGASAGYAAYYHSHSNPSPAARSPAAAKKPVTPPVVHSSTPPVASPTTPSASSAPAQQPSKPTTPCSHNIHSKLLLVSISAQHIWACELSSLVNESAVTTGMTQAPNGVDDATPTGTWTIDSKQTNQHLRGSDANGSWDDFVQYWIPFDGPIGFHDASWQSFPFGSPQYQTGGSHGCVHLPLSMMAWVYEWAPVGSVVTIEN